MKIIAFIVGAAAVLIGGLWLLQGLDVVRIEPILCVGECQALEGGSVGWTITGAIVALLGVAAIVYALRHRPRKAGGSRT